MDELELARKLKEYPELKSNFEQLAAVIENADQKTELADVAEQRIIDEARQLCRNTLQNWVTQQSERTSSQVREKMRTARKNTKKSELAQYVW